MAPRDANIVSSTAGQGDTVKKPEAAATPSNVKRKQAMSKGFINSPTDSFLSPCSQKLFKRPPGTEVSNNLANVAKLDLNQEDMDEESMESIQE